jgi:biopolymer transport protein ExbD
MTTNKKTLSTNKKVPSTLGPLAPRPLRLRLDTQGEDVRVEVVPLIDVIFCILTFFILAAVGFSRQQAISIDLPKASSGTAQGREILVVSLNDRGQVFVEQQPVVTKDQFLQRLQDYRKQNPNGLMALYASTNATYNEVVQVLDLLRQVGGDRVALATLPGENQPVPGSTPSVPPATGVPGVPPYPGTNPYYPYNPQNPASQYNPAQPQLPPNPDLPVPGIPGANPGNPQSLPGQPGVNPGTSTVPTPGAAAAPNTNGVPGNLTVPSPGSPGVPNTNNPVPGNSTVPSPGGAGVPNTNNAPPQR